MHPLVMNDFIPFFRFDMVFEGDFVVIDTDADNASFILPFLSVFLQHILIVLHRSLTWWTPGCPKVDQQNLILSPLKCLPNLDLISS